MRLLLPALLVLLAATVSAGERRLTTDGHLKRDPVFVDGGRAIVYTLLENPRLLRLMKLDLATGESKPYHDGADKNEFEASFSDDGGVVAYVQNRGNLSLALVVEDAKGDRLGEVKPAGGFSGMRSPAVAPDGKRILYAFPEGGRQHLFSVDAKAGDRKQLTDSSGVNNWPAWSADGRRIAFGSTRDGNYELYVMNADGSDVRRLTDNRFQDARPRFSPDDARIAFTSTRDGNHEVYVMNADGTGLARITTHDERDDYPAWHPDGDRLVIVSERRGRHDLYLIDLKVEG